MPLPAYILSGGQSRRFGSDKSRHEIDGQPQLLRLWQRLVGCGHPVYLVADHAERYADFGLVAIVDEVPGSGPLAGLAAALAHCQSQPSIPLLAVDSRASHDTAATVNTDAGSTDAGSTDAGGALAPSGWLLLVNCDQLHWDERWTGQLQSAITPQAQAVVFYDRRWQPLPGLYHISLLPHIRQRLQQPQLSLQALLDSVAAIGLSTPHPPSQHAFNYPSDLHKP